MLTILCFALCAATYIFCCVFRMLRSINGWSWSDEFSNLSSRSSITSFLLTKEYLPGAPEAYTGTPRFLPLTKTSISLSLIIYLFFVEKMLPNISKAELAELTRKMRGAASLPKESLTQKKKAPIVITQTPTD